MYDSLFLQAFFSIIATYSTTYWSYFIDTQSHKYKCTQCYINTQILFPSEQQVLWSFKTHDFQCFCQTTLQSMTCATNGKSAIFIVNYIFGPTNCRNIKESMFWVFKKIELFWPNLDIYNSKESIWATNVLHRLLEIGILKIRILWNL